MPSGRITRAGVTRWFDEYNRTTPGAANRALNLLCRILNHAIVCGRLRTIPARGIKWNPSPKLTRFLSREEVRRLHRELDRYAGTRPSRAQQADVIRLLLLSGCRKSEILTLRWQDEHEDTLNLADSKTGTRRVLLSSSARAILDRQPRTESVYVFRSPKNAGRPLSRRLSLWRSVHDEALIEDVRIHDLLHSFASQAVV